jgi:hypothetical protein
MTGAALLVAACALLPSSNPPLTRDSMRALRWFAPGTNLVNALTTRPVSCPALTPPVRTAGVAPQEAVGRLAFESPALLGGAAGRMGLSCAACHINGRDNPEFFVAGVSSLPGTADVTSSLFSKVRGNGAFDPAPIPDIAARDGKQIRDRRGAAFRAKVHGLIAEEFDGQEPSAYMLDAVIAYMDDLNTACPNAHLREPVTADMDLAAANEAFAYAQQLEGEDRHVMARAARERLERLYERFGNAGLDETADALVAASRAVETWMDAPGPTEKGAAIGALAHADALVARDKARSLYEPEVLRAALAR